MDENYKRTMLANTHKMELPEKEIHHSFSEFDSIIVAVVGGKKSSSKILINTHTHTQTHTFIH